MRTFSHPQCPMPANAPRIPAPAVQGYPARVPKPLRRKDAGHLPDPQFKNPVFWAFRCLCGQVVKWYSTLNAEYASSRAKRTKRANQSSPRTTLDPCSYSQNLRGSPKHHLYRRAVATGHVWCSCQRAKTSGIQFNLSNPSELNNRVNSLTRPFGT